jgi:hypothetical protein
VADARSARWDSAHKSAMCVPMAVGDGKEVTGLDMGELDAVMTMNAERLETLRTRWAIADARREPIEHQWIAVGLLEAKYCDGNFS